MVQDIDLGAVASAGVQVIRPDLTADQARRGWQTVPLIHRLTVLALVPVSAAVFMLFGSRRVLGRFLATEDVPTPEDYELREAFPALMKLIADDRERLLVEALLSILSARADEPSVVAVLYGAGHMAAVGGALAGHGYRPRRVRRRLSANIHATSMFVIRQSEEHRCGSGVRPANHSAASMLVTGQSEEHRCGSGVRRRTTVPHRCW